VFAFYLALDVRLTATSCFTARSKEGEASVFKPDDSNNLVLVARVQAADWIRAGGG
jgi:hypothetical protein